MTDGTVRMGLADARTMLQRGRLAAAPRSDDRPALHAVRLVVSPGIVQVMSADGFALMVHRLDTEDAEGNADVLLDLDDVNALLKALPRATRKTPGEPVTFTLSEHRIAVEQGAASWAYTPVSGTFPNMAQVCPRGVAPDLTPTEQIAVSSTYLARAAKFAGVGDNSGTLTMHLPSSAKQPMSFTVRDHGSESSALLVVMPMFVEPTELAPFVARVLAETAST